MGDFWTKEDAGERVNNWLNSKAGWSDCPPENEDEARLQGGLLIGSKRKRALWVGEKSGSAASAKRARMKKANTGKERAGCNKWMGSTNSKESSDEYVDQFGNMSNPGNAPSKAISIKNMNHVYSYYLSIAYICMIIWVLVVAPKQPPKHF